MFYIIKDKKIKCMSSNKIALERILESNEKVLELDLGGVPTDLVVVEDDGTFNVTVVEYAPTKAEQVAQIKNYYDKRFDALDKAVLRRRLANTDISDLQTQYKTLQAEMVAKIKGVE